MGIGCLRKTHESTISDLFVFFVVGVCVCVKGISVGLWNGVRILIHLCYLNQFALVGTLKVALAKF